MSYAATRTSSVAAAFQDINLSEPAAPALSTHASPVSMLTMLAVSCRGNPASISMTEHTSRATDTGYGLYRRSIQNGNEDIC